MRARATLRRLVGNCAEDGGGRRNRIHSRGVALLLDCGADPVNERES